MQASRIEVFMRFLSSSERPAIAATGKASRMVSLIGRRILPGVLLLMIAPLLGGCGTTSFVDKLFGKDEVYVEEPADKLYNEGLFLLNEKKNGTDAAKKFE